MIFLKSPSQIDKLDYVNKIGAEFLNKCKGCIKQGVYTFELEDLAKKFCKDNKVSPSFYGYKGFSHLLCVSINNEILHGFPGNRIIKNGDIVSVDFGIEKDGYVSDSAFTKIVGKTSKNTEKLVNTTKECLYKGIEKAIVGNRISNISKAIQRHAIMMGFDVIRDFVGHGVGFKLHESPKVPNYISNNIDWKLKNGMVIAIEPMLVEGTYDFIISSNNWTIMTADSKNAAHFEHSIAITEGGPKILSELNE